MSRVQTQNNRVRDKYVFCCSRYRMPLLPQTKTSVQRLVSIATSPGCHGDSQHRLMIKCCEKRLTRSHFACFRQDLWRHRFSLRRLRRNVNIDQGLHPSIHILKGYYYYQHCLKVGFQLQFKTLQIQIVQLFRTCKFT